VKCWRRMGSLSIHCSTRNVSRLLKVRAIVLIGSSA
jgi:hypothetical protein